MIAMLLMTAVAPPASAELHWQNAKKEPLKVRLIALAWSHPPSSVFSNEEVFVAEKQLGPEEFQLVKLVYGFLSYQPRLIDYGFDYSVMHELNAVRVPECDETLAHMTSGGVGDYHNGYIGLKYSKDAPVINMERRKSALPCYLTTPEDYGHQIQ
jgi:hypothetical protein